MSRSNLYTFLIYPGDSAPDNYVDIIRSWHIPVLLSPLHTIPDNELYGQQDDGDQMKKHIHVMVYFGSGQNKSFEQVNALAEQLHGTRPWIVNSRNGLVRYFIHADDPDKQQRDEDGNQWDKSYLLCFAGFEIGNAFDSFQNDEQYYDYIENVIYKHKLYNFSDLVRLLKDTNCVNELSFLRRHSMYIRAILDGEYQKLGKKKKPLNNGE